MHREEGKEEISLGGIGWEKTMGDLMEESSPLALTRQARAVPSCGIKQIFSSFFVGSKAQKNLQRLSAGCEWENCF
ncbi:MAG: hypothetical protein ACJAT3_001610 [Akkermansiaceae bacterium]